MCLPVVGFSVDAGGFVVEYRVEVSAGGVVLEYLPVPVCGVDLPIESVAVSLGGVVLE